MNETLQIIFGAGNKGRMLVRMLEKGEAEAGAHCIVDNDPGKWGTAIGKCPIREPKYLLTLPRGSFRVHIAVGPAYPEVRDKLIGYGLTEHLDFFDACITPARLSDLDNNYQRIRDRVRDYTLLSDERLQMLYLFARAVEHLPGEIAEVGVYRGGTACLLASVYSMGDKVVHLFDTFGGIPPVADDIDVHREGDFSDTSLDVVAEYLGEFGNVAFHPGIFPDSVSPEISAAGYCFVHVDADMYRSVVECCSFFYPRLVKGGMMLFDDYGFPSCPGVKKGVDEYFSTTLHKPIYLPTGQALIICS